MEAFFAQLPAARRQRMQAIRRTLLQPGVRESVIGATWVLETPWTRIRVASLTRHIGVYFPAQPLLDGVRARHPELRCGSRSVSIRDDQYLPLYELQRAALRTFLPQATPVESDCLPSADVGNRKFVSHASFPRKRVKVGIQREVLPGHSACAGGDEPVTRGTRGATKISWT